MPKKKSDELIEFFVGTHSIFIKKSEYDKRPKYYDKLYGTERGFVEALLVNNSMQSDERSE